MNVPVYNMQGKEVAQFTIDEKSLGGEINADLLHAAGKHIPVKETDSPKETAFDVSGRADKKLPQSPTNGARQGVGLSRR